MKKLLFLGACLVALASQPVVAQTGTPEVAVLSFYHNASGRLFATIVRGKGTPEKQDTKGSWDEEAQFQQQVIAKLYQEGYVLKSTFPVATTSQTTLVFTKGQ